MSRLFVYGTLKRGFSNARELDGAVFERRAATASGYALYAVSGFPALVRATDGVVRGEVYAVSADELHELDVFENAPDWYQREPIVLEDGSVAEAYVMSAASVQGCARIDAGDFLEEERP